MKNNFHRLVAKSFCICFLGLGSGPFGRAADSPGNEAPLPPGYTREIPPAPGKPGQWQDPKEVLPEVNYDELPITEVAADLKQKFPGEFDVLFPVGPSAGGAFDWRDATVQLRLKHVKASEIFNAMNLVFESGKTPLHWELTMNGHRPTVLLRMLPQPQGPPGAIDPTTGLPLAQPPVQKPMVFFVGDLIGDPKSGRMTVPQIVKTFDEISKFGFQGQRISYYDPAQLLIFRGTDDDIRFVQSTLAALRDKALLDAQKAFAREHGDSESSFWPEQWTKNRRAAQSDAQESSSPSPPAPAKTNATTRP